MVVLSVPGGYYTGPASPTNMAPHRRQARHYSAFAVSSQKAGRDPRQQPGRPGRSPEESGGLLARRPPRTRQPSPVQFSDLRLCLREGRSGGGAAAHPPRARRLRAGHLNQFINLYAKCGEVGRARELFDGMRERNVVSWNAMIAGYCLNGCFREAALLFATMIETGGEVLNQATYLSALRASVGHGDLKHGQQLHARLVKDPRAASGYLTACSAKGPLFRAASARRVPKPLQHEQHVLASDIQQQAMPPGTKHRTAASATEQQAWLTEQATCSVPSAQENPSSPSSPRGDYNGYTTRAPRSSGALTAELLNGRLNA
ncbi:hypothetical protein Taro_022797 [Colocasia esculenta]|uniref:Pentatricopeptide repeat-containing protein n=1 Tax=Colocasia esculenta TaxID=4460 RepID=A0A843V2A5_COLES|nr:hypothetical protein [Colocasia esculenta]